MGPQESLDLVAYAPVARSVRMAPGTEVVMVARNSIPILDGGICFALVGLLRKAGRKWKA